MAIERNTTINEAGFYTVMTFYGIGTNPNGDDIDNIFIVPVNQANLNNISESQRVFVEDCERNGWLVQFEGSITIDVVGNRNNGLKIRQVCFGECSLSERELRRILIENGLPFA